jgi:adenosylmethionine-8-amino-7-oxononanoate aminotransferase
MGGVAFRRHVGDVLREDPSRMYVHGSTWGGHPVAAAVGIANLVAFEDEDVLGHVRANGPWLGEQFHDIARRREIVADVRGVGYFWALELARQREPHLPFDAAQTDALLNRVLAPRVRELGLICRVDAREAPVVQLAPPLVAGRDELTSMVEIVDTVLGEADEWLAG